MRSHRSEEMLHDAGRPVGQLRPIISRAPYADRQMSANPYGKGNPTMPIFAYRSYPTITHRLVSRRINHDNFRFVASWRRAPQRRPSIWWFATGSTASTSRLGRLAVNAKQAMRDNLIEREHHIVRHGKAISIFGVHSDAGRGLEGSYIN
jgi:hypothetical protein